MEDAWSELFSWRGGPGCPGPVGTWIEIRCRILDGIVRKQGRIKQSDFDDPAWRVRDIVDAIRLNRAIILAYRIRTPRGLVELCGLFTTDKHEREAAYI